MQLLSQFSHGFVQRYGLYEAWQLPLTVIMLFVAAIIAKYPTDLFVKLENLVSKIAQRPYLSAALIAGVAILARAALWPLIGIPQPIIPDEFSHILQAKTYLAGRLANHVTLLPDFETLYVILSPTYASMYSVLKSFPIFVGYVLGIGAWGGVLLSMVGLTVAVYWMVREWIDSKYAIVAALIVIVRFGLFSLWVNSYWGGAFTALGGVLLVGGYKAVTTRPNILNGAAIGLGVVILMTTRPYEGLFYSFPFGVNSCHSFLPIKNRCAENVGPGRHGCDRAGCGRVRARFRRQSGRDRKLEARARITVPRDIWGSACSPGGEPSRTSITCPIR